MKCDMNYIRNRNSEVTFAYTLERQRERKQKRALRNNKCKPWNI